MPDTQPLAPADLLIDEENPRISQPNSGQHKALRALAEHLGSKLQALAVDIVENGLDPSSLPIVMRVVGTPVRYVVLEGNRRLAALRALENPESLVDAIGTHPLKELRRLSRQYHHNPIETVDCVIVDSREDARHWIELRHTGENAGAGIVRWGSDESARFRARTGPPELHSQALDLLQRRGDLSPELRRKLPATSFKRLMETPAVRAKLGVELQRGVLHLLADENRIAKALMYVVDDLASGKTKVGQIYTKTLRQRYANDLPADVVVTPNVKSGQGTPASGSTATATSSKPAKTGRKGKKRDRLITRDCILSIPEGRINEVEIELRKLSLEDHTNAISVLFRVFLELSVDNYIERYSLGIVEEAALQKKLAGVASDLVAKKKLTEKQRTPVSRACQRDSFLAPSISLMHQYVHNPHVFPAPGDLRANWDSLQPFIAAMWTP
jgi:hypothetical protein